jgi:hypothetical protein
MEVVRLASAGDCFFGLRKRQPKAISDQSSDDVEGEPVRRAVVDHAPPW